MLFSGNANNIDASAVTSVTVPTADPTLRFLAKYGAEFGFDYGYVQVSTDGGATYTTIAGDKTVDAPLGPGLNGTTTGSSRTRTTCRRTPARASCSSFRYVSDGGVNEGGLLVDDITRRRDDDQRRLEPRAVQVADADPPDRRSTTGTSGWWASTRARSRSSCRSSSTAAGQLQLSRGQLALASPFQKVVAIVAYDEPTEQVQQYAPYTLKVNGVLQPGGTPAS